VMNCEGQRVPNGVPTLGAQRSTTNADRGDRLVRKTLSLCLAYSRKDGDRLRARIDFKHKALAVQEPLPYCNVNALWDSNWRFLRDQSPPRRGRPSPWQ
jgi:hypothetical protein